MTADRTAGNWRRSMTEPSDVELHAASAFSFLAGASQPESLIERAARIGMPAIALWQTATDSTALPLPHRSQTASGESTHRRRDCFAGHRQPPRTACLGASPMPTRAAAPGVLCASQTGYQNLCQLITRMKMRETSKAEGAATFDDLEEFLRTGLHPSYRRGGRPFVRSPWTERTRAHDA